MTPSGEHHGKIFPLSFTDFTINAKPSWAHPEMPDKGVARYQAS